jgi:phosphoribosylformylglycinamidine cyclo-ligase
VLHHAYAEKYPETFDPGLDSAVVYQGTQALSDIEPGTSLAVGRLLLSPTRLYLPVIRALLADAPLRAHLRGIIHCTGGGQAKALKFAPGLHLIKDSLRAIPPVFRLIQRQRGLPWRELFQVFHMGHRLEVYVPPSLAPVGGGPCGGVRHRRPSRRAGRVRHARQSHPNPDQSAEWRGLYVHRSPLGLW